LTDCNKRENAQKIVTTRLNKCTGSEYHADSVLAGATRSLANVVI